MAIFSMNISKISKSSGASAVKSSAYIHRERWKRDLTGEIIDYRKKITNEEDVYGAVLLPKNAPKKFKNPINLWNSVEAVEKNSNALLARRIIVALPREFSVEEDKKILQEYCQKTFVDKGMCADIGIHWNKKNPHAHIMLTTRPFRKDGSWGAKERKVYKLDQDGKRIPLLDGSGKQKVDGRNRKQWQRERVECFAVNHTNIAEEWRASWEYNVNKYLEPEHKVDHRSYMRQGIDMEPQIHVGYSQRRKRANEIIKKAQNDIRDLTDKLQNIQVMIEQTKKEINLDKLFERKENQSLYFGRKSNDTQWNFGHKQPKYDFGRNDNTRKRNDGDIDI